MLNVALPLSQQTLNFNERRTYFHLRMLLKGTLFWHRGDLDFVFVGKGLGAGRELIRSLKSAGNTVIIHIDAPWDRGQPTELIRPFAAMRKRAFATGAARLARICNCALILCNTILENDGSVTLEWGEPILPTENADENQDLLITNQLLDKLEIAIGQRPTQYMLNIGSERKWDSHSNTLG